MVRCVAVAGLLCALVLPSTAWGVGTVVLDVDRIDRTEPDRSNVISGSLVRELGRQALLIAARDELGLRTRDATLRERAAEGDGEAGLGMTVNARTNRQCDVRVTRTVDGVEQEVFAVSYEYTNNSKDSYVTLAPQFEAASRKEWAEALRGLGLDVGGVKGTDDSEDAEARFGEIDALLAQADVVSQFLAVRQTHAVIGAHGESPAALTRLVRGYAHLGLLTEPHWTMATNALKARSIIYAQRLLAKYPGDRRGLACRAYAYGLAGIHFAALDDLAAAAAADAKAPEALQPAHNGADGGGSQGDEAEAAGDGGAEAPWQRLIGPFARFDIAELDELVEEDSLRGWASVLGIWAAYASGDEKKFADHALARLKNCREAYSLVYLLGKEAPVGVTRMAEQAALTALAKEIPARLRGAPGVPASVVATVPGLVGLWGSTAHWPGMLDALAAAGDGSEMDWPLLGALLEDVGVCLAATVINSHQSAYQDHPLDGVVATLLPVVERHPTGGYFQLLVPLKKKDEALIAERARGLHFRDTSRWMYEAFYATWYVQNELGQYIGYDGFQQADRDFTCPSLVLAAETLRSKEDKDYTRMLMREMGKVSPHCPVALIHQIKQGPADPSLVTAEQLAEWKVRAANFAAPWNALGALHVSREEYDEAIVCYEKSFAISQDNDPIHALARIYEAQEKFELVVPTLERYLEVEDRGLGHTNIQVAIAQFLMGRKEYEKAKEHAVLAAQSYSSSGLWMAAFVCELAGDKDEADRWYGELSRAYPNSTGKQWFLYRGRAGMPPGDDAQRLAEQELGDRELWTREASGWWPVVFHVVDGRRDRALKLATRRVEQTSNVFGQCQVLMLATELGKVQQREAALAQLRTLTRVRDKANQKWDARFVRTIDAIMQAKTAEELPSAEMEALLTDYNATIGWCDAAYFLGKAALVSGFEDIGRRYLEAAVGYQDLERATWHLAGIEMAALAKSGEGDAADAEGEGDGAEAGRGGDADDDAAGAGDVGGSDAGI